MAWYRKRKIVSVIAGLACAVVATMALAVPGPVSCGLVAQIGLDVLPDGTRVQRDSTPEQRLAVIQLQAQARLRIADMFGPAKARPVLVFLNDASAFYPLAFNAFGSAHFIGNRACVVIGPKGTNVDVVSHELMHAELLARLGFWHRMMDIPVWFDEGLAMQVDWRPRYDLETGSSQQQVAGVRSLVSVGQFNRGNDAEVTHHYMFAKAEVSRWLEASGRKNFYEAMARIRAGESFGAIVDGQALRQ